MLAMRGDGGMEVNVNQLETRVARLEAHVEHISSDITEIKTDVRGLRDGMEKLRTDMDAKFSAMDTKFDKKFDLVVEKLNEPKIWTLSTVGLGLLGIMAHGFHWI